MSRRAPLAAAIALSLVAGGIASAAPPLDQPRPGAIGLGDPYFPTDGNGGYDVLDYDLELAYDPGTDVLDGTATITAVATHALLKFNLDFSGMTVENVSVNGTAARWSRNRDELSIMPRTPIANGATFTVVVEYTGVPATLPDNSGFLHTDDGSWVAGQPHGAATWFPANDHPLDVASFRFEVTVPEDLEVVANGILVSNVDNGTTRTWTWDANDPMATYLATVNVGEFLIDHYVADGTPYWDAYDPDLFDPVAAPTDGTQFALTGIGDLAYTRLTRVIDVPAGGATLSFDITYAVETNWDYVIVEAHTVGQDDWTTLPDGNGNTSQGTGSVCPFSLELHPFLAHYQSPAKKDGCAPTGTTGEWWGATGASDGVERWSFDLAAYAGSSVEIAITYVSDDTVQDKGVFVDDIVVTGAAGSTSFEDDGNEMDGWTVGGPPEGSGPTGTEWTVGTAADAPAPAGVHAQASLAPQPDVIAFLASLYGEYPFEAAGGIVDDDPRPGFALETQTRPIYGRVFFDSGPDISVVVHELAHQWVGDNVRIASWSEIWLNEGFATYSEWLAAEAFGVGTTQEAFDFFYNLVPAEHPFWSVIIGDPGVDDLFDISVYWRGGMTLHQLRLAIGDDDFFELLHTWTTSNAGEAVTTDEFIALAESISGQQLDDLFETWLFTPGRPVLEAPATSGARAMAASAPDVRHAAPFIRSQVRRYAPDLLR